MLPDHAVALEHQDTVLHLLDHALTDQHLVMQVDAALTSQRLIGNHPPGKQMRRHGNAEETDTKQPCLKEIAQHEAGHKPPIGLLKQHGQRSHCSIKQHQPPLPNQPRTRQGHQQHYTQTTE